MSIGIVTTSINKTPSALKDWAKIGEVICAGDKNVPSELPAFIKEIGGTFIPPDEQSEWICSGTIGWRCIQRRNIAILEAIRRGYEFVVIVDDDNYPLNPSTWGDVMMERMSRICMVEGILEVWNPGSLLIPSTRARGVPFPNFLRRGLLAAVDDGSQIETAIVASLWIGDPDIDAMERMVNAPTSIGIRGEVALSFEGGFAPINSQSTSWRADALPLAAVIPHLGRYDDIWGSFIAERIMREFKMGAWFGFPLVEQERNDHDLLVDFDKERLGYEKNEEIVHLLQDMTFTPNEGMTGCYMQVADELEELSWFPRDAISFMRAWVQDVEGAM